MPDAAGNAARPDADAPRPDAPGSLDEGARAELTALLRLAADTLGGRSASLTVTDAGGQRRLSIDDDAGREPPETGDAVFHETAPLDPSGGGATVTLCLLARAPHPLADRECASLRRFAQLAAALMTARSAARAAAEATERLADQLRRRDRMLEQAERMARFGSWTLTLADETLSWSDGTYHIHGLPAGQAPGLAAALAFFPPASRALVGATVAAAIERHEPFDLELDFVSADGEPKRVRSIGAVELHGGRAERLYGVFQDVTEQRALEDRLRRAAEEDALTGIANRAAFDRALEAAMRRADASGDPLLVAIIDLDGFKAINDTLGHRAGDDTLCAVAKRLTAPWLRGGVAGRIGGDEFALFVEDAALCAFPAALAERLEAELRLPIEAEGLIIQSSGSIGIARHGAATPTVRDLLHAADTALYLVKQGRVGRRRRAA